MGSSIKYIHGLMFRDYVKYIGSTIGIKTDKPTALLVYTQKLKTAFLPCFRIKLGPDKSKSNWPLERRKQIIFRQR